MPANLATKCPGCGAGYKLKDASAAGRKMKCRRCDEVFVIQVAGGRQPQPAGARKRRSEAPADEFDDDGFDDFGADDSEFLMQPRRKKSGKRQSKSKSKAKSGSKGGKTSGKKSKRKSTIESGGKSRAVIAGGVALGVVVLIVVLILLKPPPKEPIKPPESYAKFTHPINNLFSCEYPSDWELTKGGRPGSVIWAKFETGDAQIHIRQGASGGALGDIFGAASPDPNAPEELTAVARLHAHPVMKNPVADEFDDYSEGEPRTLKTKMGDARVSEFSASGSFGAKIKGVRGTLLGGGGKQLRIVCRCPEGDWDVCAKVFEHVIASIQ